MKDIRFFFKEDFEVVNIGFVSVMRNQNHIFEYKNGKKNFSLIFVENGALEYDFKHKKIIVNKGDMLFIPKNLPYKTKYLKNNTTIKIILFDITKNHLPFLIEKNFVENSPEFYHIFSSLTSPKSNDVFYLKSKLYEILYYLQKRNYGTPKKYQGITLAIKEIHENYQENHKILYYAQKCKMSESNFRKLFKEYTGKSPIEYRNHIRISMFEKLMESREFTISEAAYLVGFNNMSFFYDTYNKFKTP